jgi:hypothetical protein
LRNINIYLEACFISIVGGFGEDHLENQNHRSLPYTMSKVGFSVAQVVVSTVCYFSDRA